MRNYFWGGKETNRVGTHEFVDIAVAGAEPFYCVNFSERRESDSCRLRGQSHRGRERGRRLVSYANDPDNKERSRMGAVNPIT
jgi:alpha-L-arabinofuranosidase